MMNKYYNNKWKKMKKGYKNKMDLLKFQKMMKQVLRLKI